jgi:hypothetical protein
LVRTIIIGLPPGFLEPTNAKVQTKNAPSHGETEISLYVLPPLIDLYAKYGISSIPCESVFHVKKGDITDA